jgi:hypothetical protein
VNKEHTCPIETHYDWRPANSVKYLQPWHQDVFDNDHTMQPRQIMAIEKSNGNSLKYMPEWRTKKAIEAATLGDDLDSFEKIPALLQRMVQADPTTYYHLVSAGYLTDRDNRKLTKMV